MASLPAVCPHCGLMFPTGLPMHAQAFNSTTKCPLCGSQAHILSRYQILLAATFEHVSAPGFKAWSLDDVRRETQLLAGRQTSPQNAVARIEQNNRKFGSILREWLNTGAACAAVIIAAAAYYHDTSDRPTNHSEYERFQEAVEVVMQSSPEDLTASLRPVANPKFSADDISSKMLIDGADHDSERSSPQKNRKLRRFESAKSKAKKRRH